VPIQARAALTQHAIGARTEQLSAATPRSGARFARPELHVGDVQKNAGFVRDPDL